MRFTYFKGKSWNEITREERYYCANLYFLLKADLIPFFDLLIEKGVIEPSQKNEDWEIGFEVCLYRDFIKCLGFEEKKEISKTEFAYLQKRTFDLCFFSEKKIIIIEAKAWGGFDNKQLKCFKNDIENSIKKLFGKQIEVETKLIGIASSTYRARARKATIDCFSALLSWKEIAEVYKNIADVSLVLAEVYSDKKDLLNAYKYQSLYAAYQELQKANTIYRDQHLITN